MAVGILDPRKGIVWQGSDNQLTPEVIEQLQALEARKRMQGTDTSPIGHWTQGAARVVDALGGVLRERRLNSAAAENTAYNQEQSAPLIAAITGQSPAVAASPDAAQTAAPIASAVVPDAAEGVVSAPAGGDWLRYSNQNATRSQPLDPKLVSALSFLPELGVSAEVFSGGQDAEGPNRTGSHRHDHGGAGDMRFFKDGRQLDWANEADRTVFEQIVQRGKQSGITGFGAGPGYMGQGSMHVGFGTPAVWGAGGRGENAPDWLKQAYNATPASAGQGAIAAIAPQGIQPQAVAPELPAPVNVASPPPVATAQQPVQVAQNTQSIPPAAIAQALRVMSDPRANQGTRAVAQALIQRQQAQEQAAQEQSTWMQRQQYTQQQQNSDPLRQLQLQEAQIKVRQMQDPNANVPDAVKSLDLRAQRAGLQPGTPEYNNFFITQGVRPPSNVGTPPAGYKIDYDANNNPVSMSPIAGSPAANEAEARSRALANQQGGKETITGVITDAATKARQAIDSSTLPATGTLGGLLSGIGETGAAEVKRQVDVLKSNATIENLNAMRASSPTGAALGAVSDRENAMLAAKVGALDPSSPRFKSDLEDYERTLLKTIHGPDAGEKMFTQTRQSNDPDIQAAKDAIARGAPREAVIKRLQDAGLSTEGL